MSNGVGKTIKNVAMVVACICVISSAGGLIAMILIPPFWIGGGIIVLGSLIFGLFSLNLYGFGQLVEDTARIAKMLETSSPADLKALSKRGNCELCDKKDVDVVNCKIVDSQGTRYRNLCVECMAKTNAEPTEKK